MKPLLDAVLVDISGVLVDREGVFDDLRWIRESVALGAIGTSAGDAEWLAAALGDAPADAQVDVTVIAERAGVDKSDPTVLVAALEQLGLDDPARVLYVGDSADDEEAAAGAGVWYLSVTPIDCSIGLSLRQILQAWIERTAGHRFEEARARIVKSDIEASNAAATLHGQLTKPPGSLGRLEHIGIQLAAVAGANPPPLPEPATVGVFAADHGVVDWNVSPWPQEVTGQMVANFTTGGAAINVLARHIGADVIVVDVGVATPLELGSHAALVDRRVRNGTDNLAKGPAMVRTDALLALDVGAEVAELAVAQGARCLITGEMGIGNTTAATAIIASVTGAEPAAITGRGSGADDEMIARKIAVIDAATESLTSASGPLTLLEQIGGFEIAALAGFIVGGAAARVPVLVDGVIADAALLIACQLAPDVIDYVIAGHRSTEPAAAAALDFLQLTPVLDLDLRLGEGTGAALALPIVQGAAKILREMATFDSAGITEKD